MTFDAKIPVTTNSKAWKGLRLSVSRICASWICQVCSLYIFEVLQALPRLYSQAAKHVMHRRLAASRHQESILPAVHSTIGHLPTVGPITTRDVCLPAGCSISSLQSDSDGCPLAGLTCLNTLNIGANEIEEAEDLAPLKELRTVKHLFLEDNPCTESHSCRSYVLKQVA